MWNFSSILPHLFCFTSWIYEWFPLKQIVFFKVILFKNAQSLRKWDHGIAFIHTLTEFFLFRLASTLHAWTIATRHCVISDYWLRNLSHNLIYAWRLFVSEGTIHISKKWNKISRGVSRRRRGQASSLLQWQTCVIASWFMHPRKDLWHFSEGLQVEPSWPVLQLGKALDMLRTGFFIFKCGVLDIVLN